MRQLSNKEMFEHVYNRVYPILKKDTFAHTLVGALINYPNGPQLLQALKTAWEYAMREPFPDPEKELSRPSEAANRSPKPREALGPICTCGHARWFHLKPGGEPRDCEKCECRQFLRNE